MDEYALRTPVRQTQDGSVIIVSGRPEHTEGIAALDAATYVFGDASADDPFPSEVIAQQFLKSLDIFPEGQFIALDAATGSVVGKTQSMRYQFDPSKPMTESWAHSTGDGWLTTHDPLGDWMYGVDSAVHPAYQSKGIGALLMDARFEVLRRLNLRGLIAGSMIMGYGAVAHEISPDEYMREVVEGKRFDNNLSKQLKKGFRALNVIPDYVYDPRTLNYAVAILWENPDYNPALGVLPTSVLHLPVAKPQPTRTRQRSTVRVAVKPAAKQTGTMRTVPPTA